MDSVIKLIRDIPDFPKPGIIFKDITPVLADGPAFQKLIDWYVMVMEEAGDIDIIAGIESRGFIFGAPIAERLGVGFVPIRKPGKLPFTTHKETYDLEYGTDTLEIHTDAVWQGARVAIIDDLLATGGTAGAAVNLVEKIGGEVAACAFVIELGFLDGRKKIGLPEEKIFNFIQY